MGKIKRLIFSMFKAGLIGFGGGNALIPVLQQITVEEQMVSAEDYEEDVVVASITPGAFTVKLAGGIGRRYVGSKGLLLGAVAMALPGVLLTVLLSAVITILDMSVLQQIRYIAVGVTAFICCLLTEYIVEMVRQYRAGKLPKASIVFAILVVLLTCGKNLYRILGIEAAPLFSVATIHIFIMTFFLLFYLGSRLSRLRLCLGAMICLLYILCVGASFLNLPEGIRFGVIAGMVFLACYGLFSEKTERMFLSREPLIKAMKEIGWIALVTLILSGAAFLVTRDSVNYLGNGFLSTLLSYGGGDAYLTVADGFFVHSGLIDEENFYHYLVPVANLIPGSFLCKLLSGVGYFLGFSVHGNVWEGILVAFAGFFVSLLASCSIFSAVGCFYGSFRELYFIKGIGRWIRPIVSGLMVTVMLSLVWHNVKLGNEQMLGTAPVFLMLIIYLADLVLLYRVKMKNGNIVLLSSLASFIVCNFLMK